MQREHGQTDECDGPGRPALGLTPDEPYVARFADDGDSAGVARTVRSGSRRAAQSPRLPTWEPPQGRGARSLLPDLDPAFRARLADAEAKVDRGELLNDAELRYLAYRGTLRLLGSRRPG